MGDLEELKKLGPEDRVKKLKEIEENNRKEIEEAQKLMTDSLREIEIEDKIKRDIPIPQLTSVDVDTLFGQEEKDMFRTKRYDSGPSREQKADESLEESIEKEKMKELPPEAMKQYTQQLEQISSRLEEFRNMGEEHFNQYKQDYNEEITQMYDNVKQMQHYAGVGDQIEKMHLTEQIGELSSSFGEYKRGGV
ncbi:hypothetical protein GF345_06135 [Candidatus Woesearchaeota archaeon]|nr:hypothetical protein [Candidatus Woesearchaeota archaeon]